jgi:hypothetical protein
VYGRGLGQSRAVYVPDGGTSEVVRDPPVASSRLARGRGAPAFPERLDALPFPPAEHQQGDDVVLLEGFVTKPEPSIAARTSSSSAYLKTRPSRFLVVPGSSRISCHPINLPPLERESPLLMRRRCSRPTSLREPTFFPGLDRAIKILAFKPHAPRARNPHYGQMPSERGITQRGVRPL